MTKSLLRIAPLALSLLSAALAPAVAGEPAPAPAVVQPAQAETPAACPQDLLAPAAGALSLAPSGASAPEPLFAAPCPVVRCLYSPCTRDNECTAFPGGSCALYCNHPKAGCCTYP